MARKRVSVNFDEAQFILQLLKRRELSDGETRLTRSLVSRFRSARGALKTDVPADTEEVTAQIFAAGAGEGGVPSSSNFKRDGVRYSRFSDGRVFRYDPWQQVV